MKRFDYLLVGGGLQNGLLALALREQQPQASVAVIEASDRLGGNHTWSFHIADVPVGAAKWIRPLVVASWPGYRVRFPGHARTVSSRYTTVSSDRFDAVVRSAILEQGWCLRLNSPVSLVGSNLVKLESGEEIAGHCVIDSRGPRHQRIGCGYQKFFGLEVETDGPWPEAMPAVMDATVAQTDGFHFLYTLPFTSNRVLVEDTYFSDTPTLDHMDSRRQIECYLRQRVGGWRVVREEAGVLPMPWEAPKVPSYGPLLGGYSGGWIHPATGYSFPVALRFALAVAATSADNARQAAESLARRLRPRCRFARFLNWLLFQLVPPDARWQVFARLYHDLPAGLLARFYAMEFSATDAARILIGRPPRIDLLRPLRNLFGAHDDCNV